jgi:hypothetical protein
VIRRSPIALALALALCWTACTSATRQRGAQSARAPQRTEDLDAEDRRPEYLDAIVRLDVPIDCNGTVIAPMWVLTSAHCVHEVAEPLRVVSIGAHGLLGRRTTVIRCVLPSDAFGTESCVAHGAHDLVESADLALLRLEQPLVGVGALRIADAQSELRVDERIEVASWRLITTASDAFAAEYGQQQIVDVNEFGFVTMPGHDENGRYGLRTLPGDSGAPAVRRARGEPRIVGVLSGGMGALSPDTMFAPPARTSNRQWIERTLAE